MYETIKLKINKNQGQYLVQGHLQLHSEFGGQPELHDTLYSKVRGESTSDVSLSIQFSHVAGEPSKKQRQRDLFFGFTKADHSNCSHTSPFHKVNLLWQK